MSVIVMIAAIALIVVAVEAVFILPDKMPWNRRRKKK